MMQSNIDTKTRVWEHLEELQSLFPTKSYQDLQECKAQNDKERFERILEIIFDANSELAQKVEIGFMGIEEIAQALKIEAYDSFVDKKIYINRANYWVKSYEKEDDIYAILLNNLVALHDSMGEYEKALPLYEKALKIHKEVLGENHPDTATNYNNLASLYESMGEYEKALPLYEKALKISKEVLGENHPDTATSYNNLASLYESMGEYEKALPLFEKALKISKEVLGENHPDTAQSYNNLASLYHSIGEYEKALPLFEKALKIREEVLDENHPDTAQSYNNLALLYQSMGEYEKALPLYQKALEIREEVLGENHPDTAQSYNNLAVLYYKEKKYNQSLDHMKKASVLLENSLSKNHPYTQRAIESLKTIQQSIKPLDITKTYLDAIKIKNYFSLKDIEIENLGDKKEIYFVGENGDGKTILLQAIVLALKDREDYATLAHKYIKNEKDKMYLATKDTKNPNIYIEKKEVKNLFAYGINRNKVDDKESRESKGYAALFDTPSITNTTFLREPETFFARKFSKKEITIVKDFVKKLMDLMDNRLQISIANGIKLEGVDEFDMLSEGYKTTIIWLTDLLSRLMESQPDVININEYEAIVLIDEVDLYLHPKWKYNFMHKLRQIFPKIQFIVTTHSLVTVLGASEDAVFYKLYRDEEGHTQVSQQIDDISKFTSNILMTSPLFGLQQMEARGFKHYSELNNDDYVFHRIHKKIKERIKEKPFVTDEEVDAWLGEELDKELAELND